jgi:hypothetical protein
MRIKIAVNIFILFCSLNLPGQSIDALINYSLKLDYDQIISLSDSIDRLPESSKKNDAIISLAYAYLNNFKFHESEETLEKMTNPNNYQSGAKHEITGILYLSTQIYKKAVYEFQEAARYYAQLDNHDPYYEACNNLAYSLVMTDRVSDANIIADKVIDYAETKKDTTLLVAAYINKLISYPEQLQVIWQKLQTLNPTRYKKTILYHLGKTTNDPYILKQAQSELSNTFYNVPRPIQIIEIEEIKLKIAELAITKQPHLAIHQLKQILKDSLFLPLGLQNKVHSALYLAYKNEGVNDSGAYHLLKIRPTGESTDTLRNNIPVALASITEEDKRKSIYLGLIIVFFIGTIFLIYKWFQGRNKEK